MNNKELIKAAQAALTDEMVKVILTGRLNHKLTQREVHIAKYGIKPSLEALMPATSIKHNLRIPIGSKKYREIDIASINNRNVIETCELKHFDVLQKVRLSTFIKKSLEGPQFDLLKQLKLGISNSICVLGMMTEVHAVSINSNVKFNEWIQKNRLFLNTDPFPLNIKDLNKVLLRSKMQNRVTSWQKEWTNCFGPSPAYTCFSTIAKLPDSLVAVTIHCLCSEFDRYQFKNPTNIASLKAELNKIKAQC